VTGHHARRTGDGGTGDGGTGDRVLVVRADLDLSVVSPAGRRGRVRLSDRDGVLVVQLSGLPALATSLPSTVPAPGSRGPWTARVRDARRVLDEAWSQPVDVVVGGRTVLRRRAGRWRPTATAVRPVLAVVAGLAGALAGLLALRRRTRAHR
jgi:hypothetical protein